MCGIMKMNIPTLSALILPALTPLIGSFFISSQSSFMHKTEMCPRGLNPHLFQKEKGSQCAALSPQLSLSFLTAFLSKRKSEESS